jgi:hypothetical protein
MSGAINDSNTDAEGWLLFVSPLTIRHKVGSQSIYSSSSTVFPMKLVSRILSQIFDESSP